MKINEKTLDISLLIGAAAAILFASFAGFARQCDELQEKAFRLHILANSDTAEDQLIKNSLRDYILSDLGYIFEGCPTKERAAAAAKREITFINERANEYLAKTGCPYSAVCSVEKCSFPTRKYGSVTLPAGEYDALKIVLGNGEGHNWWCVLFPSVCLPAAGRPAPVPSERYFYKEEKEKAKRTYDSMNNDIEFRFALYEILRDIF